MRTAELAELAKMVSVYVKEPEHIMYIIMTISTEDIEGNDTHMLRKQYESRSNHPRHIILTDIRTGEVNDADEFVRKCREPHSFKIELADVEEAVAWWLRNVPPRDMAHDPICDVDMLMGKCVQYNQGEDAHIIIQDKSRFCCETTQSADYCNSLVKCIKAGAKFYKKENIDDIPFVEGPQGNS